ncbi:neuropeptide B [Saccopteryx leptura]|uniref:neuropeptide B n=1 Tax=Saccopteryx leptura TaxID=249018 RepID=UPI00339CB0CD
MAGNKLDCGGGGENGKYKQAAWPSSYLVGRYAGLLFSFRESPYARRSKAPAGAGTSGRPGAFAELRPACRALAPSAYFCPQTICVKDGTPNLQIYERLLDDHATFQGKAVIFLSLHAADCRST